MRHCKDTREYENDDGNRENVGVGYFQKFAVGFWEGQPFFQSRPVFFGGEGFVYIFLFVTTVISDGLFRRKAGSFIIVQEAKSDGDGYD